MARRNRRPIGTAVNREIIVSSPATEKRVAAPAVNKPGVKKISAPKPAPVSKKSAAKKVAAPLKSMITRKAAPAKKPAVKKSEREIIQDKIDALSAQLKDGATRMGQNKKQMLMDELVDLQKQLLELDKKEAKLVTATKTDIVANRPKGTKSSLTASRAYI